MIQFDVTSILAGGSNSPCGSASTSIRTLQGVQRANFTLSYPRQDAFGWDGGGNQEMVDRPRADLSISYVFDGTGTNERSMGFVPSLGGYFPALLDLASEERNYYAVANLDRVDEIGYSGRNVRVVALGNAAVTHYDFSAQVGQPSLANVVVQGLNLLVQPSGTGQPLPTIDKQAGTGATQTYTLPAATRLVSDYFSAAPSAITLSFDTGCAVGMLLSGANACPVQSFSFNVDLPRRDVRELGWAYPNARPIAWPITIGIRADVILDTFQLDALNRYGCPDSGHSFIVGFQRNCTSAQDFSFRFEGAKLETQSFGLNVGGGPANGSLNWSVHLNDINRKAAGFPAFYIDTPERPVAASGGVETIVGNYKIHTFTESGSLTVTSSGEVDLLVLAGGGGGGWHGGGGGAGGMRRINSRHLATGVYAVSVGPGGAGSTVDALAGGDGSDSSIDGIVSKGGGGGGAAPTNTQHNGRDGGSGGGAGANMAGAGTGGAGTSEQGNDGGPTVSFLDHYGGGGGKGSAGRAGTTIKGGNGGDGSYDDISGECLCYAAGGGGVGYPEGGSGGSGVGGNGGSFTPTVAATAPTPNRGSGGGGGKDSTATAGSGGVVVVRYRIPNAV